MVSPGLGNPYTLPVPDFASRRDRPGDVAARRPAGPQRSAVAGPSCQGSAG